MCLHHGITANSRATRPINCIRTFTTTRIHLDDFVGFGYCKHRSGRSHRRQTLLGLKVRAPQCHRLSLRIPATALAFGVARMTTVTVIQVGAMWAQVGAAPTGTACLATAISRMTTKSPGMNGAVLAYLRKMTTCHILASSRCFLKMGTPCGVRTVLSRTSVLAPTLTAGTPDFPGSSSQPR